jgi:PAS domain-containing protein
MIQDQELSIQALARECETLRRELGLRSHQLQEANRQLQEATEQFQAMYDQGLFAARLRLDGTVADINRSAVEVCGFNRADILDRPFWECGWWNRSARSPGVGSKCGRTGRQR